MRLGITETLGLAVGLAVLATAVPASADPAGPNTLPISVTTIKTDESDALADALTSAIKSQVRASAGWSLADGDYSLEVLSLALRCPTPPDAACEVRIADKIKTDRFIWGTVDAKGSKAVGTLHLWTRGKGETSVPLSYSANMTEAQDDALLEVAHQALATLTGGPPKGQVKIKAADVNGQVFVDDKPAGTIADGFVTVFVPVGEHKIEVRAVGYANASATIEVSPTKAVEVKLAPIPQEEKSSGPSVRQIATYGAFGLSGTFLAVGLYSTLKVNSINTEKDDILTKYETEDRTAFSGDVCDAANGIVDGSRTGHDKAKSDAQTIADGCSSGGTFQVLQFVFYGLSAASAGAGAYLLMTDKHADDQTTAPKTSRLRVIPSIGQNNGSVSVQFSF